MNPLWRVTCNWFGEDHIFWSHAYNKDTAKRYACIKIAKKLGVTYDRVYNYFDGKVDNMTITGVK